MIDLKIQLSLGKNHLCGFFFTTVNPDSVKCRLCPKEYKNFKNTTNLITPQAQSNSCGNVSNTNIVSNTPPVQSTSSLQPPGAKKLRHDTQLRLMVPAKVSQKAVDDALLDMVVLDYQPIQIVENVGFRTYTKKLNPEYKLPSRKVLGNKMLEEVQKLRKFTEGKTTQC